MNYDLFYQAANARALGRSKVPQVWSVSQVKINVYRARQRILRELGEQIPEMGGHR